MKLPPPTRPSNAKATHWLSNVKTGTKHGHSTAMGISGKGLCRPVQVVNMQLSFFYEYYFVVFTGGKYADFIDFY